MALTLTALVTFAFAAIRRREHGASRYGKKIVMMPWECRMSNYQTHSGMTVPLTGEVAWARPEGRKAYYRGTVTSLTYEFSS